MPYIITNSSGDEVIIPDGGLNTDYSIQLVGRNYENYGAIIAKTQLSLLENFATDSTPPNNPTDGQLWYDKDNNVLRVYDSTGGSWLNQTPLVVSSAPSNNYNQIVNGFMYFDTDLGQLYLYANGAYYRANSPGTVSSSFSGSADIGNPTEYGTNVRTIFLYDTDGVPRSVYAVVNISNGSGQPNLGSYFQNEQLIAIFSTHDEFTVADSPAAIVEGTTHVYTNQLTESGGIGLVIKPGINTRTDATAPVNYAKIAERANASYALNTGSGTINTDGTINDNGGLTIDASNVFHAGSDSLPAVNVTYDLGSETLVFAQGYIKDLFIGEQGSTGSIQPNGDSVVTIGLELNPIDQIYVDNINVAGNIILPDGGNIGDENNYVENVFVENVYANVINIDGYTLPETAGTNGQTIFIGADGTSEWMDPYNQISQIYSADSSITITQIAETPITQGDVTLNPVAINVVANTSSIRQTISGSEYIDYNNTTGVITLVYPNPFKEDSDSSDGWDYEPADFVIRTGAVSQDIGGEKTFNDKVIFAEDTTEAVEFTATTGVVKYNETLSFKPVGGGGTLIFNDSGDIITTGTLAAFDTSVFSDQRLKENIKPIEHALDKVSQIAGYTYNMKGDPTPRTGVIAQEVQSVLPEAVNQVDDHLTVSHASTTGLLFSAINELRDELNAIKKHLGME